MFRETKMFEFLEFSSFKPLKFSKIVPKNNAKNCAKKKCISNFNHYKGHYKEEASIFKFIVDSVMKNIFLLYYNLFITYYLLLLLFVYYILQFI